MLRKVIIFDNGYGGELFADYFEKELPIFDVVRVIDWSNSEKYYKSARAAREQMIEKLRPYANYPAIVIVSNILISLTSIKYLSQTFPNLQFFGFSLGTPKTKGRHTLVLGTKETFKTIKYIRYRYGLGGHIHEVPCDEWTKLIDGGEYYENRICADLIPYDKYRPKTIIIACSHLLEVTPFLRRIYGPFVSIVDGRAETLRKICLELGIRGAAKKKK